MTQIDPDLENAYALDGPKATRNLYAKWAQTYDSDFATDMDYLAPLHVANCYIELNLKGPVLDMGAGTGLVGAALRTMGLSANIDATDLSPEMLDVARQKDIYGRLFEGDITKTLDVASGCYAGAISAGTFTHGHVGPEALGEVLRILRPDGWAVLSVNAAHWNNLGFEQELGALASQIKTVKKLDVPLYGPNATGPHAMDRGWILQLQRA